MTTLIYDGSFEGYLSALALINKFAFEEVKFLKAETQQIQLFSKPYFVKTERAKAEKIWTEIEKKGPELTKTIYFAFLSDEIGIESILSGYIQSLLKPEPSNQEQIQSCRKYLETLQNKVNLEKYRILKDIQFKRTNSGVLYAEIRPVFNTIPLITKELKQRFKDKSWVIHDTKRHFGIQYIGYKLEYVQGQSLQEFKSATERELSIDIGVTKNESYISPRLGLKTNQRTLRNLKNRRLQLSMQKAG